jgi:hypothetical protein
MDNIYFRCLNGLGDKLLDAIGLYVFCKVLGCHATIDLNGDVRDFPWGNNRYDEHLFAFSGITLHHGPEPPQTKYIDEYNPSVSLSPYKIYRALCDRGLDHSFESFSQFYVECAKELIRPSPQVLENLPEKLDRAYGIHLRKTDKVRENHCASHENSHDEFDTIIRNLLDTVRTIVETEDNPTFLIVSEDAEWKAHIVEKMHDISAALDKPIDIVDLDDTPLVPYHNARAILDMFALSRCKAIIQGVKYSTFSILAALLGRARIINFSRCLLDDRDCLIYAWNSVIDINGQRQFDAESYEHFTRGCMQFVVREPVVFMQDF